MVVAVPVVVGVAAVRVVVALLPVDSTVVGQPVEVAFPTGEVGPVEPLVDQVVLLVVPVLLVPRVAPVEPLLDQAALLVVLVMLVLRAAPAADLCPRLRVVTGITGVLPDLPMAWALPSPERLLSRPLPLPLAR